MIKLVEINEANWIDFAKLSVEERQKRYLANNIGIIARGYVYRDGGAKVLGIAEEDTPVGLAMVRGLDEEPACYDLQQFMIDAKYQGKGYGTEALRLILSELEKEHKYDCVEVCVKKDDAPAIHVYEKTGFADTGYVDEDVPDSYNLVYKFKAKEDTPCVTEVKDAEEKKRVTRRILEALPDWFGIEESREEYIACSVDKPFFAVYEDGKPAGFLYLKETGKDTVELAVMGVLQEYHRKGIGEALFKKAKEVAKQAGYTFMQVKTVKMGKYDDYDATNRFYLAMGFKELEVFPLLWDEWNPCQVYVMIL